LYYLYTISPLSVFGIKIEVKKRGEKIKNDVHMFSIWLTKVIYFSNEQTKSNKNAANHLKFSNYVPKTWRLSLNNAFLTNSE
jgi:hypothetical protein